MTLKLFRAAISRLPSGRGHFELTCVSRCDQQTADTYRLHASCAARGRRTTDERTTDTRTRGGVGKDRGKDPETTLLYSVFKCLSIQGVLSAWHMAKHLGGYESRVNQRPHPQTQWRR